MAGGAYLVVAENSSLEEIKAGHKFARPSVVVGLLHRGWKRHSPVKEYCEHIEGLVERVEVLELNLYDFDEIMDVVHHIAEDADRTDSEVFLLLNSVSPVVPAAFEASASFLGLRVIVAYGDAAAEIPVPPASVLAMPKKVLEIIAALAARGEGVKLSELASMVEHREKGGRKGKTDEVRRRVATVDYYINRYLKPAGLVVVGPSPGEEGRSFRIWLTDRGKVVARRISDYLASYPEGRTGRAGYRKLGVAQARQL